jgi:hypothetical protein
MRLPRIAQAIHQAAKRGNQVASLTGAYYGGGGPFGTYRTGGEGIDWSKAAGDRYDGSLLMTIIEFACRQLEAIPIEVFVEEGSSGKPQMIEDHPAAELLKNPQQIGRSWYTGSMMQALQLTGEIAWGNSYTYKHRAAGSGRITALETLPVGTCYPFTWIGSGQWVSEYRITTPSGYRSVRPEDVLHIRYRLNPKWPPLGRTPYESCLPELVADSKAQRHQAAILENGAVMSALISPKQPKPNDSEEPYFEFSETNAQQLEQKFNDKTTRDGKGSVYVATIPLDVQDIGLSSDVLNVAHTTGLAEERMCSLIGFHPAALGLGVGMRESNNRASLESAIRFTFENGILPLCRRRADQLTLDFRNEFLLPGEVLMYDESVVPVLKDKLLRQMTDLCGQPLFNRNEAREVIGMNPVKGGDEFAQSKAPEPKPTRLETRQENDGKPDS